MKSNAVLLIGAGGLGCGACLGLGAAGMTRLGVVDDDRVDLSNLHRQILHRAERVGVPKTASLEQEMAARFPEMEVAVHELRFTAANAADLISGYDVVIDASDNLSTKFLVNDAAVLAGKPLVHAAAVGTGGQLLTVPAGGRPCYRCLFEDLPPPDAEAPSCAEAGVLGPVPAALGALAACEAVHLLTGETPAFVGRLLRYEGTLLSVRAVPFRRNPLCRVCGERPSITTLDPGIYRAEPDCSPRTAGT